MLSNTDVLFISHGGGPRPLFNDPDHQALVDRLKYFGQKIDKPEAILVLSAHWETDPLKVIASPAPDLLFDYYNFPDEAYQIEYACPGDPALAAQVQQALQEQGFPTELEFERGLDHGVFVPLKLMYPAADIPVIQLSLNSSLDAEQHLAIGEAMRNLNTDRLLILGSGFTFHNMRAFHEPSNAQIESANRAFEDWLEQSCGRSEIDASQMRQRLVNWEQAPHARFCQPREEHLIPLHVCAGVAGRGADDYHRILVFNKQCSLYHWRL